VRLRGAPLWARKRNINAPSRFAPEGPYLLLVNPRSVSILHVTWSQEAGDQDAQPKDQRTYNQGPPPQKLGPDIRHTLPLPIYTLEKRHYWIKYNILEI